MAYQFAQASSQYVRVLSSPVAAMPVTIAVWYYADSSNGIPLIVLHNSSDNSRVNINRSSTSDVVASAVGSGGAIGTSTASGVFSSGKWQHAAAVHGSASSRTVYVDGVAGTTDTVNAGSFSSFDRVSVGTNVFSSSFWDGRFADIGIWNVALTAAEIASLAKGVACRLVRPQSLVFYAPLVRDLIDTARGLTITNNNTATVAVHPRIYA